MCVFSALFTASLSFEQQNQWSIGLQCVSQCACSFITDPVACLKLCCLCRNLVWFGFAVWWCILPRFSVVNVVLVFNTSLSTHAPSSPIPLSYSLRIASDAMHCLALSRCFNILHMFSAVSVVLPFHASLNARAPSAPILFPAFLDCSWPRSCWFCRLLCDYIPPRSSVASAVLAFNASLNARVPSSHILLSVSSILVCLVLAWFCFAVVIVAAHLQGPVWPVLRWLSTPRSMHGFLLRRSRSLFSFVTFLVLASFGWAVFVLLKQRTY